MLMPPLRAVIIAELPLETPQQHAREGFSASARPYAPKRGRLDSLRRRSFRTTSARLYDIGKPVMHLCGINKTRSDLTAERTCALFTEVFPPLTRTHHTKTRQHGRNITADQSGTAILQP